MRGPLGLHAFTGNLNGFIHGVPSLALSRRCDGLMLVWLYIDIQSSYARRCRKRCTAILKVRYTGFFLALVERFLER